MIIKFELSDKTYSCDTSIPFDISIPLIFNGDQPNTYDVNKASAKGYEANGFIGDTRRGGGCNFEEYILIPHCNGTHTECVGHISYERISINKILKSAFMPGTLISVIPEKANQSDDSYIPKKNEDDHLITKWSLEEKLLNCDKDFFEALIIRTLPNDDSKKSRRYMKNQPPYFSIDAMRYIAELNVKHLLIDIPSLDRTFDEGKLSTHHIFWDVAFESHDVDMNQHSHKTITEMIYVPDEIKDGKYLMNLQIPNFLADAAPSRVLIYEIKKI